MANNGVLSKLQQHHQAIARLIRDINERIDMGSNDYARLYQSLRRELLCHTMAEEESFFEALTPFEECRDDVRDGRDEHEEIEELLHELDRTVEEEDWHSTFNELEDAVERHFREVEQVTFPLATRVLSPDDLVKLAAVYQRGSSRARSVARGEEPDEPDELVAESPDELSDDGEC